MRIRRGPATVTGDAHRGVSGAQPPIRVRRSGRRGGVGPGARRPASDHKPTRPSWKGVGSMVLSRRISLALGIACLGIFVSASTALAAGPAYRHRQGGGSKRNPAPATQVTTTTEPVVKDGNQQTPVPGPVLSVRCNSPPAATGAVLGMPHTVSTRSMQSRERNTLLVVATTGSFWVNHAAVRK